MPLTLTAYLSLDGTDKRGIDNVGDIKKLFGDSFYSWLLRGLISGVCIALFDGYQDFRDQILSHDRAIVRYDAELRAIREENKTELENLKERIKRLEK